MNQVLGRWVVRLALLLCVALASALPYAGTAGAATVLLAKTDTIRIMPLGDSITAGVAAYGAAVADGGYRGTLAALLAQRGYHAVFVGSRSDYSAEISERAHEGWPGYVLRSYPSDPGPGQLYGALARTALRADTPDLVLLMAGTNDLLRLQRGDAGYTLANIVNSMDLILDEIFTERPDVHVILAPVVASPKVDPCTLARFDGGTLCGDPGPANLKTLVAAYAARGFRITYAAAMATAVPRDPQHFPDGIHPSGVGYAAIAGVWLDAIETITAPAVEQPVAHTEPR